MLTDKICEESLCVIQSWFDTVTKSIHKFLYLFIAAYRLQPVRFSGKESNAVCL